MSRPILERSDDRRRAQSQHIQQQLLALRALGRTTCQTCGRQVATHLIGASRAVCATCCTAYRARVLRRG